jgi:hypothetical protein
MKRVLVLVVLAACAAIPAAAGAATPIPAPAPPQNPFLAATPNSSIHDDTWMTDAYSRPGPTGKALIAGLAPLPPSLCSAMTFDTHGQIVTVCPSSISPPVVRVLDPTTMAVLSSYTLPNAPTPPGTAEYQNFTGGGYFFLDNHDHIWSATKTNHLFELAPSADGLSISLLADYNLTSAVSASERITSALPDFRGRIWFVSKQDGRVGVLNPATRKIHVFRIGEEVENSFAVDRTAVYIVSDKRMYRFSVGRNGRPRIDWSIRYRNSGIHKPSQVDAGSGTTPTVMAHGYVAITDNADPMDVVVYRTAKHLRRHVKRTVCQMPVFQKGQSATENSLIGSGRSMIVENNYGYEDPFGPQAGNITAPGFERVDIRRNGHGCTRVWTNDTDPAPTVVPKLSTATQLIYAYTQTLGVGGMQDWSWVAISAVTGQTVFRQQTGTGLLANNNYAGVALGPNGVAYLGTIGGIRTLRDG